MQRIAVFLLNSMASRVDKCQKLFLGEIGTITVSNYKLFVYIFIGVARVIILLCEFGFGRLII